MEGLGKLAGGIAHDFNNLLTAIIANSELVARSTSGEALECAHQILGVAKVAADLCRKILAYAGETPIDLKALNLRTVVQNIVDVARSGKPNRVSLDFHETERDPCVLGDRAMLSQLVLNLITNAFEAIGNSGHVDVWTGIKYLEEDAGLLIAEGFTPGEYAYLQVRDDGVGIDAEAMRRIFDPFFSTKPEGRGLGLATVFGVTRRLKGGIEIDTAVDKGTTFTVFFPVAELEEAQTTITAEPNQHYDIGIALVDDQAFVRDAIMRLLRDRGFSVIAYSGGEDLLANMDVLRGCGMLLLDLKMPGIDGIEVYRRIRQELPDLAVCFMSGATSDTVDVICLNDQQCESLPKPFNYADFDAAFHRLCGGNGEKAGRRHAQTSSSQ